MEIQVLKFKSLIVIHAVVLRCCARSCHTVAIIFAFTRSVN